MRKVCVVLTARASYAKLRPILAALRDRSDVMLQVVCAASALLDRFGRVENQVLADGFPVSGRVYMQLDGETPITSAKSTGYGVSEFASIFDQLSPDVILVMADRFEVIAPAIAAAYLNIPLAHAQGGESTGNIDEKVRHAITKLADMHFPATERARDRLLAMGEDPASTFCTGCPSIDLVHEVLANPQIDFNLYDRYGGVGAFPNLSEGFIIVMQHAVTTSYGRAASQIQATLDAVEAFDRPAICFWPNPDAGSDDVSKRIRQMREGGRLPKAHFVKSLSPPDFLRLLNASGGILGNSSAAIREASAFGVPAINVGDRQAHRERAQNVVDVDHVSADILATMKQHFFRRLPKSDLYGQGDAGKQIAARLATEQLSTNKFFHDRV